MDESERDLERAWQSEPDDQALLTGLIQARRRAGRPVPESLLRQQVRPARAWNAPFDSDVHVEAGDERRRVGRTPVRRDIQVPPHRWLTAEVAPASGAEWKAMLKHLAGTHVQSLEVHCDGLADEDFAALDTHPKLEALSLKASRPRMRTIACLRPLTRLPLLERLRAPLSTNLDLDAISLIGTLDRLTTVELSGIDDLNDRSLAPLWGLPCLSHLALWGGWRSHEITDATLDRIASVPDLEVVRLRALPAITNTGVARLLERPLRTLELGSLNINETAITNVASVSATLRELVLGIGALADVPSLAALTRLERLVLHASDAPLGVVAALPLTDITIGLDRAILDHELGALPATVQRLSLENGPTTTWQITPGTISALARLPRLRELRLRHLGGLEEDAVIEAVAALPALSSLELSDLVTEQIGDLSLLASAPHLERLSVSAFGDLRRTLAQVARVSGLHELSLKQGLVPGGGEPLTPADLRPLSGLSSLQVFELDRGLGSTPLADALRALLPPGCHVRTR